MVLGFLSLAMGHIQRISPMRDYLASLITTHVHVCKPLVSLATPLTRRQHKVHLISLVADNPAPLDEQPEHVDLRVLPPDRLLGPGPPLLRDHLGVLDAPLHRDVPPVDEPLPLEAHEEGQGAVEPVEPQVDRDKVQPWEQALAVPLL